MLPGQPERVAGRRDDALRGIRIERVDLLRPDTGHLPQAAAGPPAALHQFGLVDDAGQVREDESAASLDERVKAIRHAGLQHEQHRRHDHLVAVERRQALDEVHGNPELPERAVVILAGLEVVLVEGRAGRLLPRALRVHQRPPHLPVIDDGDFGTDGRAHHAVEMLQERAVGRDVLEHARPLGFTVVNDRSVHLLGGAQALAPLEVHRRVGAVPDGQQHLLPVLAGLLDLGRLLPVRVRGRGLHQDPRHPALHRAVEVVVERQIDRLPPRVVAVQRRVRVPGHAIADAREAPVVEADERAHHVRGDGDRRRVRLQRRDLVRHEVHRLVGDEPVPVEVEAVDRTVTRINLIPRLERLAPERRPPRPVEGVERGVARLQPRAECPEAEVAVARAAVLVRDVPAGERLVSLVPLGELRVDDPHLVPVDRRREAVVVPGPVQLPLAVAVDAPHLGVLLGQPARLRPAGGREEGVEAVRGQPVHDVVEPRELEPSFLGLERCPGEDADGEGIAPGLLHQAEVLVDDAGLLQPLIRVPVGPVQDVREGRDDRGVPIREGRRRPGL